jgi:hypothetical protein
MTRTLLAAISGVAFGVFLGVGGHHFATSTCSHHSTTSQVVLLAPPPVHRCVETTTIIIDSSQSAPDVTEAVVDVNTQADRNLAQARALASKDPQKASQLCRETMQLFHNNPRNMRVRSAFRLLNHIKSTADDDEL